MDESTSWPARRGSVPTTTRRLRGIAAALAVATSVVALAACGGDDGDGGGEETVAEGGVTAPTSLDPFEAGESGAKPDLPRRVALAMDNDREFAQAIQSGLEAAAEDNDLELVSANANGDSARNVQQIQQFLTQGVGALVINPIDPAAQEPLMTQALETGVAVLSVITPPATTQANADQYQVGKVLADDAATYINGELGGNANVVILNQDSVEPIRPRFQAIRDVLGAIPGATIAADIEPDDTTKEAAFETMNTILQKTPQVDVVLGADSVVLGALAALEAAGKDNPRQFLGGIDGESEALAKIREGGPYKATVSLAAPMFAYAMGQFAADWLDGESIPQAIDVPPVLLNSPESIDKFEADTENPGEVYEQYVKLFGDISYETRGNYLAYAWQP